MRRSSLFNVFWRRHHFSRHNMRPEMGIISRRCNLIGPMIRSRSLCSDRQSRSKTQFRLFEKMFLQYSALIQRYRGTRDPSVPELSELLKVISYPLYYLSRLILTYVSTRFRRLTSNPIWRRTIFSFLNSWQMEIIWKRAKQRCWGKHIQVLKKIRISIARKRRQGRMRTRVLCHQQKYDVSLYSTHLFVQDKEKTLRIEHR